MFKPKSSTTTTTQRSNLGPRTIKVVISNTTRQLPKDKIIEAVSRPIIVIIISQTKPFKVTANDKRSLVSLRQETT